MVYEVEQKFRVTDRDALVARLELAGVVWRTEIEQCDLYFAHPQRDFASTDEALRIRRIGQENRITYKGPKIDAQTKTRRELELPLVAGPDMADQYQELLVALGFRTVAEVSKRRRPGSWRHGAHTFEVALDDVDEVGVYVELELSVAPDQLADARAALLHAAAELELHEIERRSYLELLLGNRESRVTGGGRNRQ